MEEKESVLNYLISRQKEASNFYQWRQLETVWLKEKLGMSGKEVAEALNYKLQTVHVIWQQWGQEGKKMFDKNRPGGRNHAYLTWEEEEKFLASFFKDAEEGCIAVVSKVQSAYEKKIGRKVAPSTVYRILHKHGWRKIVPRKKHPLKDANLQEQVKKT